MTYVERGLYRELLDECWAEGYIPDDIEKLADICGCPVDVIASAWQVLSKCFELIDGVWINERIDQERTAKDAIRANRARAGHNGGSSKALKTQGQESKSQAGVKQVLASASKCHIEEKEKEKENNKNTLAVASAPAAPTVTKIGFDYATGQWLGLAENPSMIASWQEAYPGVDLRAEFSAMKAWLLSNPKNRKTNLPKFINNWLSKSQDRASQTGGSHAAHQQPARHKKPAEIVADYLYRDHPRQVIPIYGGGEGSIQGASGDEGPQVLQHIPEP